MKTLIVLVSVIGLAAIMPAVIWVREQLPSGWLSSNIDKEMVFQCDAMGASGYKGLIAEVSGELVEVKVTDKGTFLNFGEAYPNQFFYAHIAPSVTDGEMTVKLNELAQRVRDFGVLNVKVGGIVKGKKTPYIELTEAVHVNELPFDTPPRSDGDPHSGILGR